jgi:hypothetical protein
LKHGDAITERIRANNDAIASLRAVIYRPQIFDPCIVVSVCNMGFNPKVFMVTALVDFACHHKQKKLTQLAHFH